MKLAIAVMFAMILGVSTAPAQPAFPDTGTTDTQTVVDTHMTAYSFDSLTVRHILNINGLGTLEVDRVSDSSGGRITRLNLYSRQLSALPDTLGSLTALQHLWIQDNYLSHLPQTLGNLNGLTIVWANNNRLRLVPASIERLVRLEELRLNGNRLDSLPASMGNLPELRKLQLQNNNLTTIPETFTHLLNLRYLNVDSNKICVLGKGVYAWLSAGSPDWVHTQRCNRIINARNSRTSDTRHAYNRRHKLRIFLRKNDGTFKAFGAIDPTGRHHICRAGNICTSAAFIVLPAESAYGSQTQSLY
ncbi:MAG: hypothetical protein GF398_14030 [Chitinivibrionales bacterium]|nr:hypothetical protein [Chitinivibrionales bacterium]